MGRVIPVDLYIRSGGEGVWKGPIKRQMDAEVVDLLGICLDPTDKLLAMERKDQGWAVKEQAAQIGLDRSDLYKALKGKLPRNGKKWNRFFTYQAKLRLLRELLRHSE